MNRTIWSLGLIGAMLCPAWAQETAPTIEQLDVRLKQLEQEKYALLSPAWRAVGRVESLHETGQWQRPLDDYLARAPFPMPPILSIDAFSSPLYVQVLQIARVDSQILRNYPQSLGDFPYYEVRVRILNTWGGYSGPGHSFPFIPIENPYRLQPGQEIRLLWVSRRRKEVPSEMDERAHERETASQIWEVGKRYLLFGFRGLALDMPPEERQRLPLSFETTEEYERWHRETGLAFPPLEKVLFLVGDIRFGTPLFAIGGHATLPPGIEGRANFVPSFSSDVPYGVLADPPEELLQLLDEESVVLRHTNKERLQWVVQRLRDPDLPLWKKYRALLYVLAWDYDAPDQYLQWIMSLEPPLRAFGLQRFLEGLSGEPIEPEARKERLVRLFELLGRFLEAGQPVEVRREAGWLFAKWATVHNRVIDWERAGLTWDWWQAQRDWLKQRSHEESDEITRLLLDASWRQIASVEYQKQEDEVRQQINALEKARSR